VETPFGKATDVLGGSATYASAAASYFSPVHMVAAVGDDFDVAQFDFLRGRGVDLTGLEVVKGGKTFRWGGRYHFDLNARDTLYTDLNVLGTFDPKLPPAARDTPFVLLGNMHPLVQAKVLDQLAGRPKLVVGDTMNLWIDISRKELEAILARLDVLIINDAEARQLSGEHNLIKAASSIRRLGPRTLVIKKGEHGALLFHGGEAGADAGLARGAGAQAEAERAAARSAAERRSGGADAGLARGAGAGAEAERAAARSAAERRSGGADAEAASIFSAPAYPLEDVFDPTGAGDAFAGGFLGYLASRGTVDGAALRRAVVWGSTLASYCVERFSVEGLRALTPEQLRTRYEAFRALAHFDADVA